MKRPIPYLVFTLIFLACYNLSLQAHETWYYSNEKYDAVSLEKAEYREGRNFESIGTTIEKLVDAGAPTVTSVSVPAGTYKAGQALVLTVNMSEATYMRAGGSAFLIVTLDTGGEIHPSYLSGSGTTALNFGYTIVENQQDLTGITVGSSISTNSGDLTDADGNNVVKDLNNVADMSNVLVDAIRPRITSVSVPAGFYKAGTNLDFTVNMSEASTVNTDNGTPYINVVTDLADPVHAVYLSGSGTSALTFRYTVVTGDKASWGIGIAAGSYIAANGGIVTDIAGNSADLYVLVRWFSNVIVDTTNPTVSSVGVPSSGTYKIGQNLDFTVQMSEVTTVLGTPYLGITLDTGGTQQATYLSGSGTKALVFRYTVVSGNLDQTGIAVDSPIELNGGTLKDAAGNDVVLTLNSLGGTTNIKVDGVAPAVSSVSVPSDGTYVAGQTLNFTVQMSEATTVSGTPYLGITLDTGGTVQAGYLSGSGTSALVFRYTVVAGNCDLDGIVLDGSITANGGTFRDAVGNDAVLTLNSAGSTSKVRVDAVIPTVSSVSVPDNGTYVAGQTLSFTVHMSEATIVSGSPYLSINIDTGGNAQAAYVSGSGTTDLVFNYTVGSGKLDSNGISIGSSITANGGTLKDGAGNNAVLTLNNVSSTVNVKLDSAGPTVSSVSVPSNGTYKAGQNLDFTVRMSEATTIDPAGGSPSLGIVLDTGGTVQATYQGGSGTTALTFRYIVADGNLDQTGIVVVSPLVLNGSTLRDAYGNDAVLTLSSVGSTSNVKVDGVAPTVNSVSVPSNGTYKIGLNLDFTINMSEATTVNTGTGVPYIDVTLDTGGTVHATYTSGSGSAALKFRYTVTTGNLDADGITLASAITANGGTLKDAVGTDAVLTLNSVGNTANILVDGIAPVVNSVGLPDNGTYITGQNLDFTVNMSEPTIVDASFSFWVPTIDITFDTGGTVAASYLSGSGTSALVFRYTVGSGKMDLTGISLSNTMYKDFNTTFKDAAGNSAVLTLNGVGSSANVLVDAIAPAVSSVGVPANGTYVSGQNLDFTVHMSEATNVNTTGGIPFLDVTMNTGGTLHASYLGGSGGTDISFRYTVVAGNMDPDGIALSASLTLNGGTLKDTAGNDAVLTLNSVGSTTDVRVDAIVPVVNSVGVPANGTYISGQNLDVTVCMSEATVVNTGGGIPYLGITLSTGGIVQAAYLSGSGGSDLVFRYTVVSGNLDPDGIVLPASITSNGGTLKDAAGNNAVLTLNSVANTTNVLVDGLAPGVSSVSAAIANGTYRIGEVIPVTVIFSEAVNVAGIPALALNSGGSASYSSGSGTSTLIFGYTVGSGQSSADLDCQGTGSLTLSGGTIRDLPGNDAVLTLPALGGANSLGGQKNIVVDGIQPVVSSVGSTNANGNYLTGDLLVITLTFPEAVNVSGNPTLSLNSGGTANYASGSTTSVLSFSYTVGNGQSSADLDYSNTSALALSGGTIVDNAGNNAILTLPVVGAAGSLGAGKNLVIGALPSLTTQEVSNITATTVSAAGNLTGAGFPNPTAHGVCWSTTTSPTTADSKVDLGATSSTGTFSVLVTGLSQGTVYYLRAFATNILGTTYGNEVSFRTLKQLTISDPSISPKTYDGTTVATLDQTGTLSGIIGNEEVSVIAEASFDNKNSGYGKTVTVTYTLSGSDKNKYIAPVNSEVFTGIIQPKDITIIPKDGYSKTYGDPDPAFSYSYFPSLLAGEVMTGSLSRKAGENVGTYDLTPGSVGAGTNYTVRISTPVTFTIRKAPLTITADAKTKSYGSENPLLTCHFNGWKYSDNEAVLRTKPLFSTKVTNATAVGEYPDAILVSGAIGDNYDITFLPANFSVVRAILTVRANRASKIYGDPNPQLSFVYGGWSNADNESVLSKKPVASTTITNTSAAGKYLEVITVSGGEDENYIFNYVAADFEITPRQVIPTVTARSRCFDGTSVATLSGQLLSGVIAPDDVSLVVGNTSFSNSSPGNDKMVTADNLSLAGTKAANYVLSQTSAVAKADIFAIPVSAVSGPTQICLGNYTGKYSIDSNLISCQWTVSSGGVITSGQGTSQVSVDWNTSGLQTISVNYSNFYGCAANTPASMNVVVNPIPPDPVISASGTTLVSDAPQGNQWYSSSTQSGAGNPIPGATGPSFSPSADGWYWTQVTLADCSSGLSNKLYRIDPLGQNQYGLYPVPNHGEFTISIVTPFEEEVSLFICDLAGHKIYELSGLHINGEFKKEINLSQVRSGFYSLVILSKDGKVTRKFNISQ